MGVNELFRWQLTVFTSPDCWYILRLSYSEVSGSILRHLLFIVSQLSVNGQPFYFGKGIWMSSGFCG